MIKHHIGADQELVAQYVCEWCHDPIQDLDYAEIVWQDKKVGEHTPTIFGHTKCTNAFDDKYPNNMNAKEYLEKLI